MQWQDEGYLLSKKNFNENSLIIEVLTLDHGKYNGIVYGGLSRKHKKNFQIGNKIMINWRSKSENKIGYFNIELLKPISPLFFDDKKRSICILSASSILKILLPERQINKKIYTGFEDFLNKLNSKNWIKLYILWELSLIKELGFEVNFLKNINKNAVEVNDKKFNVPKILLQNNDISISNHDIKEALIFNKNILLENFISPNKLRYPFSRNILEKYYN
tara:strand:+ start:359 stop:1015 length:657 start_codon:yes stop_codon:yes gene_type:complete